MSAPSSTQAPDTLELALARREDAFASRVGAFQQSGAALLMELSKTISLAPHPVQGAFMHLRELVDTPDDRARRLLAGSLEERLEAPAATGERAAWWRRFSTARTGR